MLSPLIVAAPVQLERRVATVEAVVKELAEKSGKPLSIGAALRNEIVYVGLKPHEPEALMSLLAQATSAEWTEAAGQISLVRSASLRRKQAREENAETARLFTASLNSFLAASQDLPWAEGTNHAEALRRALSAGRPGVLQTGRRTFATPIGRLFARALRALPAEAIGSIPVGETARFASKPRRSQGPLSGANLGQYVSEQRTFLDELGRMTEEDRGATEAVLQTFRQTREPGSAEKLYALLTVERRARTSYELVLRLFNPKGQRVDQAYLSVDTQPVVTRSEGKWRSQTLKLEPDTAAFYEGLDGLTPRRIVPFRNAKFRPEQPSFAKDPLAILTGDAVSAVADAREGEVIEALPDEIANRVVPVIRANGNLGAIDDAVNESVVFEKAQGVQVGHARFPSTAEDTKLDRSALTGFLASIKGGRFPSLEILSGYVARQNIGVGLNGLERYSIAGAGYPRISTEMDSILRMENGGRDFVRGYGALPSAVRASLWKGNPASFATLPVATRTDFSRMLFRREPEPTVDGGLNDASAFFDDLQTGGALVPTDLKTGMMATAGPATENNPFVSMAQLASALHRKEMGQSPLFGQDLAGVRFVPAWRRRMSLVLRLSPTFSVRQSLSDVSFNPSANAQAVEALPPEHRAEIQRELALLRAQDKG